MRKRRKYPFLQGVRLHHRKLGTILDTVPYTYGDSDWGDLLTVFNGVTITHDEIGPPVTYYDGTVFEWEGRKTVERNLDVLKDHATV